MRNHQSSARLAESVQIGIASILAVFYTIAIVALFASGRLTLPVASLLVTTPVVVALAVHRPEWIVLALAALPPSIFTPLTPTQMAAITALALFGFAFQGRLHLGPRTGIYPIIGIIIIGTALEVEGSIGASLAAEAALKTLVYYTLLALVAFSSAAYGTTHIDTFVNALLIGIVAALILQGITNAEYFQTIAYTPFRGQIAYLAAIGFGVAYGRFSLRPPERGKRLDALLAALLLCLTALGFSRAAWMAALMVFALVYLWTGRKLFWVVGAIVLIIVLTVPTVQERVAPGSSVDASTVTLSDVTSGRSRLWGYLFERGVEAFPLGQGLGYMGTLTSEDIVGFPAPETEGAGYVYAHNDFLFLFVELGIVGLGLLVTYWLGLVRRVRALSRSDSRQLRDSVRTLVPILVVMFFVQLFDNGFTMRLVAERFFIAAGLICGLHFSWREVSASPHPGIP